MKPELDRVKNDLETIQKAMGFAPAMGREWLQWLKRDKWFSLWWCLPGCIVIAAALTPFDHVQKYWGLVLDQWAGILVAVTMLVIAGVHARKVTGKDGRPEGMIREAKRINGMDNQGFRFGLALLVQLVVYFAWGRQYHVAPAPFLGGPVCHYGFYLSRGGAGSQGVDVAWVGRPVFGLRFVPADGGRGGEGKRDIARIDVYRRGAFVLVDPIFANPKN